VRDEEEMPFAIFSLKSLENPIHCESPDSQGAVPGNSRSILYLSHFHLKNINSGSYADNNHIKFILITVNQHMHLTYDVDEEETSSLEIYKL